MILVLIRRAASATPITSASTTRLRRFCQSSDDAIDKVGRKHPFWKKASISLEGGEGGMTGEERQERLRQAPRGVEPQLMGLEELRDEGIKVEYISGEGGFEEDPALRDFLRDEPESRVLRSMKRGSSRRPFDEAALDAHDGISDFDDADDDDDPRGAQRSERRRRFEGVERRLWDLPSTSRRPRAAATAPRADGKTAAARGGSGGLTYRGALLPRSVERLFLDPEGVHRPRDAKLVRLAERLRRGARRRREAPEPGVLRSGRGEWGADAAGETLRQKRVTRAVQRALQGVLVEDLPEDHLLVRTRPEIAEVAVAPSLRKAQVFWRCPEPRDEDVTELVLTRSQGTLRYFLARRIRLRYSPMLRFLRDRQSPRTKARVEFEASQELIRLVEENAAAELADSDSEEEEKN